MSQSVLISVGAVVYGLTVWGVIMAFGVLMGQRTESEDARSLPRPHTAKEDPSVEIRPGRNDRGS
jgi:hypothetical protein